MFKKIGKVDTVHSLWTLPHQKIILYAPENDEKNGWPLGKAHDFDLIYIAVRFRPDARYKVVFSESNGVNTTMEFSKAHGTIC